MNPAASGVDSAFMPRHIFFVAPVGAKVYMNFTARPAGPGIAHLPEIIFSAE